MKKILIAITALMFSMAGQTQKYIQGSVQKNADPTKIDIVFKPNYTSAPGEYINFFQFSLAIPVAISGGVTATAVGVNTFTNMTASLTQAPQYTQGAERIFTWIFVRPSSSVQSWTNGVSFVGFEVTFSTTVAADVGKMVDFSTIGGGGNVNTFFAIASNIAPFNYQNPLNLFYAIPGQSFTGTDVNRDQFVQTGRQ